MSSARASDRQCEERAGSQYAACEQNRRTESALWRMRIAARPDRLRHAPSPLPATAVAGPPPCLLRRGEAEGGRTPHESNYFTLNRIQAERVQIMNGAALHRSSAF